MYYMSFSFMGDYEYITLEDIDDLSIDELFDMYQMLTECIQQRYQRYQQRTIKRYDRLARLSQNIQRHN